MSAVLLKGMEVVAKMKGPLAERAAQFRNAGAAPKLAVVRVGEKAGDLAYERNAVKRCGGLGILCEVHAFDPLIRNDKFIERLKMINDDETVHGLLVLSPLPGWIDAGAVKGAIDPIKDVDCAGHVNTAKLFTGDVSGHAPCTPSAVVAVLKHFGIPLTGRKVVIVGRSAIVGKPLAILMLAENATVTICHTKTENLAEECRNADILVAAAGRAKLIGVRHVKPGAAVVDVGINEDENGALCGDVDFGEAVETAGFITPVPGGVGAVTTTILAKNVLDACERTIRGITL